MPAGPFSGRSDDKPSCLRDGNTIAIETICMNAIVADHVATARQKMIHIIFTGFSPYKSNTYTQENGNRV
jgi:hypothetical protein